MKCLVNTHVLIWSVGDSTKLSEAIKTILEDGENECFFSAASVWEIALKHSKHPDVIPIGGEDTRQLFLKAAIFSSRSSQNIELLLNGFPIFIRIHLTVC